MELRLELFNRKKMANEFTKMKRNSLGGAVVDVVEAAEIKKKMVNLLIIFNRRY